MLDNKESILEKYNYISPLEQAQLEYNEIKDEQTLDNLVESIISKKQLSKKQEDSEEVKESAPNEGLQKDTPGLTNSGEQNQPAK